MAKPKANTLQQKLGFIDADLKTPKHDELMIWLDDNMDTVLNRILGSTWDNTCVDQLRVKADQVIQTIKQHVTPEIVELREEVNKLEKEVELKQKGSNNTLLEQRKDKLNKLAAKLRYANAWSGLSEPPVKPNRKIEKKVWEHPITTSSGGSTSRGSSYTIGFIDLMVQYLEPQLSVTSPKYSLGELRELPEKVDWEDVYFELKSIFFEVKTSIPSLGELIRQIHHYHEYVPGFYVVVSPIDTFKSKLREQGIGFLKCE